MNHFESVRKTPKTLYRPVHATPVEFLQAVLAAYAKYGRSPEAALQQAQITPSLWQQGTGGEGVERITALQMERLSAYAMHELDDEALGWFSQPMRWGSYGMLLRASLSSPTLGVALQRWCRHHGLLTQDVVLQWQRDPAQARIVLQENRPLGVFRIFCLVSMLRNLHGVACWLVDSPIRLLRLELPFPAPAYADALALLFPGPIGYDAPVACLHLDATHLAMPLCRNETELNDMLRRALYVMVKPYRRDRSLLRRVRQRLRASLSTPYATPQTAQTLAHELHLSVRSLHRLLQEEGTTLQAIKNEVRRERATELLVRTRHPVKQIAAMSGFDNVKSFARAFLGWTGQTPQQYRQQHQPPVRPSDSG